MQPSARTRDAVAILALVALVFVPFRDLVAGFPFTEKSDVIDLVAPHAAMLVRGVARGVFPLWNPTLGGGLPYMATIPLMLPFYPGAALFFLTTMEHALSWGFLLHALLGPVLL
ncbi:MAG: hypothetical protein K8I02_01375, partial [Candidatus Methylomirabilis sp.]|nr:hypothetical protein [Deltaproteobacteria bacterium]